MAMEAAASELREADFDARQLIQVRRPVVTAGSLQHFGANPRKRRNLTQNSANRFVCTLMSDGPRSNIIEIPQMQLFATLTAGSRGWISSKDIWALRRTTMTGQLKHLFSSWSSS